MKRHLGWRTLVLAMALLLVVGARVAAQRGTRTDPLTDELARYHALIAAYRSGDRTVPQQVLTLNRDKFRSVLGALSTGRDTVHPWEPDRFAAAAFMHTDAAFLPHPPGDDRTFEQLDIASQILARGGPAVHEIASRWYVAVSRLLRDQSRLEDAERLLEFGRVRLVDDPAVLCESGTLEEYFATDARYSPGLHGTPAEALPKFRTWPRLEGIIMRRREHRLERATTFLRASLEPPAAEPTCALHLGRVLILRDDYPAAEPYLRPLRDSNDAALSYLASLFLAAAAERRSEWSEATSLYRDAIARVPRAHAAYFGLSSALYAQGHADEARTALAGAVQPDEDSRRDPYWWYFVEPGSTAKLRLDSLRQEVVK